MDQEKKFFVRVRFDAEHHGPWDDVVACSPGAAAMKYIADSMTRGSTCAAGSLPCEVVENGAVDVKRFTVDYKIEFGAREVQ